MKKSIINALENADKLLKDFLENSENIITIDKIAQEIADCFCCGNKIIICGNGGSSADAIHFAEEFTGNFRKKRKALPVIALTDPSYLTCVANDFGFEEVFARGVEAYGKDGDILIAISTSGNSKNIIKAVEKAKNQQMKTIALLGKDGGKLKKYCNYEFIIPGKTTDRIQEIHMLVLHILIEITERYMFPENYS